MMSLGHGGGSIEKKHEKLVFKIKKYEKFTAGWVQTSTNTQKKNWTVWQILFLKVSK